MNFFAFKKYIFIGNASNNKQFREQKSQSLLSCCVDFCPSYVSTIKIIFFLWITAYWRKNIFGLLYKISRYILKNSRIHHIWFLIYEQYFIFNALQSAWLSNFPIFISPAPVTHWLFTANRKFKKYDGLHVIIFSYTK